MGAVASPEALSVLTLLQEEVGRWVAQQEKETRRLQRPGSARLFPLPGRGHKYAVEIRGQLNGSAGPGHSELTLLWDRTGVPGGSVSTQTQASDPLGFLNPRPQTLASELWTHLAPSRLRFLTPDSDLT